MKEKNITVSDIQETPKEDKEVQISIEGESPKRKKAPPTIFQIIKSRFFNRTVGVILLMTITTLSVFGWLLYTVISFNPPSSTALSKFTEDFILPVTLERHPLTSYGLIEPSEPRIKENPINGNLLTASEFDEYSDRRPVAVMINNHYAARPSSNLQKADIIYETLVESGITRHMAVFWQNAVTKVGSIRSARQPYLEWLSEYDAIYIHDGYASSTDPRINAGGNIWNYDIHSISTQGAWRDSTRFAPHDEYSSIAYALDIGEKNGWTGMISDFAPWKFKNDATSEERGDLDRVDIKFHTRLTNGGMYDVSWQYQKNTNSLLRSIGGVQDIDLESGDQLRAKTVIIQETSIIPSGDEKAHVITRTTGEGDALIIQDGKVIEGKWEKKSRTSRTRYYNRDGRELLINRGLIWVEIISTDDSSFAIIEQ